MKTGILTRKACFNHRENLLTLQEPVLKTDGSLHTPCSTLYEIAELLFVKNKNSVMRVRGVTENHQEFKLGI